ncbi:hypothetical protein AA0472_2337 [Acetobacter estunensis NRIC 0472]|uniref:ArsR family transcriptional regulator n=1 Tax=Acetobacter estunensis TaxID=104097 RepID=A0A967EID0_9PROT|nr:hypothetical protein [Acetobacter estunensis]NHO55252.1 hypothetical protein [Acetobacter estunensis]GBQ27166.1 hypothetical protein AA0472_2337 [Acetobacter estunensis NRIC 0472]
MSVQVSINEDRRLRVLKCLTEMSNHMLNEDVLLRAVISTGRDTDHDLMRDDLAFLEKRSCVRIERLPSSGGELWKVVLTDAGQRVAQGEQVVSGVGRRLTS